MSRRWRRGLAHCKLELTGPARVSAGEPPGSDADPRPGRAWARDGVEAVGAEFAEAVRGRAGGAQVVLLSMSGFAGSDAGGAVLWDRSHLEAAVCGLVTLPDLVEASSRALFFGGTTHETLAGLLASPAGDPPAGMGTPDRLPPPWPVLREGYDGIPAQLVLGGEDGWDKPSGIAAMDNGRLVVRLLTASAQGPPRASQEREVQDDNGVGRPQADVERLVVRAQVAVQDPGGSPDQVVLPLGPPSRVHCNPPRLPEQRIELDRGNASRVLSWRNRADLPAPPRPRMTTRRTPP